MPADLVHLNVKIPRALRDAFQEKCDAVGVSQGQGTKEALRAWIEHRVTSSEMTVAKNDFTEVVEQIGKAAEAFGAISALVGKHKT